MAHTPAARRGRLLSQAKQNTGPRFVLVCGLVLLIMAVTMAIPEGKVGGSITTIVCGLALVAAIWASRVAHWVLRIAVWVTGAVVLGSVLALLLGDTGGQTANATVSVLLIAGIPAAIVIGLRDERTVNLQTVFAALSIYLLLGLFFTFLITVVARVSDVAYFAEGTDGTLSERVYFSYVTLATLGYGDLTPATNLGRSLAVFEAIFGSLYLITVVSVVISRMGQGPSRDDVKTLIREAIREERTPPES